MIVRDGTRLLNEYSVMQSNSVAREFYRLTRIRCNRAPTFHLLSAFWAFHCDRLMLSALLGGIRRVLQRLGADVRVRGHAIVETACHE